MNDSQFEELRKNEDWHEGFTLFYNLKTGEKIRKLPKTLDWRKATQFNKFNMNDSSNDFWTFIILGMIATMIVIVFINI